MSAPICDICKSVAPYGDERNYWIGAHRHRIKRFIQKFATKQNPNKEGN